MIKSKLKVLLAMHDMNQKQLAEATKIRPQTITNIVNNKIRQIPVDALDAICETLNCDISDIFEHIPNEPNKNLNRDLSVEDELGKE